MTDRSEFLIKYLLDEDPRYSGIRIPASEKERFDLYRSLVNIRAARDAAPEFLDAEDSYLKELTEEKGVTDISDLEPVGDKIYLWQGDITALRCGAIVNAANSGMTGCYQPLHSCIDNCIHTFAGTRLRYKCHQLMEAQGYPEPTGRAKITPAYNLPCDYVIHTVGPIVSGRLTAEHRALLRSSYRSCLELAAEKGIESIAFCCISTGVFGFPQRAAAEIAIRTVREFLRTHDISVIFNVYKDEDREIYEELLCKHHKN